MALNLQLSTNFPFGMASESLLQNNGADQASKSPLGYDNFIVKNMIKQEYHVPAEEDIIKFWLYGPWVFRFLTLHTWKFRKFGAPLDCLIS